MSHRIGGTAAAAAAAATGASSLGEIQAGKWRKFPIAGEAPAGEFIAVFAIGFNGNDADVKH